MLNLNNIKYTYRGRVSLYIILKSMDIKQGDIVAVQSYTCSAVVEAILALRAKPLFIDINNDNLIIDEKDLSKKIENIDNLKALVIQYTFGVNFNPENILRLCKKKNIYLIEDCCHINPKLISQNTIGLRGDASFFSFEWGKPIVGGIGGAYLINNKKLVKNSNLYYKSLESAPFKNEIMIFFQYFIFKIFYNPKTYWILKDIYNYLINKKLIIGNFNKTEILFKNLEFNYKSLYISKILVKKKMNKKINHNHASYELLDKVHQKCKYYGINYKLRINKNYNIPLLRVPFLLNNKKKILLIAKSHKIELAEWYNSPVHPYEKEMLNKIGYFDGSCPNAEEISAQLVSLPANISNDKLNKFFEIILKYD